MAPLVNNQRIYAYSAKIKGLVAHRAQFPLRCETVSLATALRGCAPIRGTSPRFVDAIGMLAAMGNPVH